MTETPSKYQYQPKTWEDKSWLQQNYWGKKLSLREIGEQFDVPKQAIADAMKQHGIPSRMSNYNRHNSVSMFKGFYGDGVATRADAEDIHVEKRTERDDPKSELNWQKAAKRMDEVGDGAIFQ